MTDSYLKTIFIICSEAGMGTNKLVRFGRSSCESTRWFGKEPVIQKT
jgi:hypothetical protein